jgi:hypothetical protein
MKTAEGSASVSDSDIRSARRRAIRELIGKIPTKDPNIVEEVYLSELIRCRECQQTAPMGIEVITVKRDGGSRKVLRHGYFCRSHGHDYEMTLQSLPIRTRTRE